jgi:outer membrane immunogenic protein
MKHLLGYVIAATAVMGSLGVAFAADVAKEPQSRELAWTGWYAGLNAGGIWSDGGGLNHTAVAGPCNTAAAGCNPGVPALNVGSLLATGSMFDTGLGNEAGFIGGAQFGYNWKFSERAVLGFEADIAWTGQSGKGAFASPNLIPIIPGADPYNAVVSAHLDYLGTLRGRLGFLATPALLVYGTGGLAYGGVRGSTIETALITPQAACGGTTCPGSGGGSFSDTRFGWTAGVGGEWMFSGNWGAKVEYLYYDLGRVNYATSLTQVCNGAGCLFNGVVFGSTVGTSSLHYAGSIARIGANYHFNGPTTAKY